MPNDLYSLLALPVEGGSHDDRDHDEDCRSFPDSGTVTATIETTDSDRAAIMLGCLSV